MKRKIKNIVLLGSGNVATHLALNLKVSGYKILQVFSRTANGASQLAEKLGTAHTHHPENIVSNADLYIISVSDDAIQQVSRYSALQHKTLVHTSGSIPMSVLERVSNAFGVFYPFQTFTKSRSVDFKKVPVLLEACNQNLMDELEEIANHLSNRVVQMSSEERAMLHISAVFACNFTNHMYAIANELAKKNHFSFNLLQPLIEETTAKALVSDPLDGQTGPAVRFDQNVLDRHMNYLKNDPGLLQIYRLLSESIQNYKRST